MNRLILQIIAGILGIFLASRFVPGVSLEVIPGQSTFFGIELAANWQILILHSLIYLLITWMMQKRKDIL